MSLYILAQLNVLLARAGFTLIDHESNTTRLPLEPVVSRGRHVD
jgi:hypothetical protein